MEHSVKNLIIGGGQAGLAVSHYLQEFGQEYVVLDAAEAPAHAWRSDRWDSFTLVTPNWTWKLPGDEYSGENPGGYLNRDEIVQRFENYITRQNISIQYNVRARSMVPEANGFQVETSDGVWKVHNVIVATGIYQEPRIPPISSELPESILQISSGKYRSPDRLPPGAVLVVGSAQSGCQIAEELYQSGRKVYLCTGKAGRVPRRYRGRDIVEWLEITGFFKRSVDKLPSMATRFAGNPHVTGKNGGHSLNLHQFYRDGVILLGRLQGIQEERLFFDQGLKENLAAADKFEKDLLTMIDGYIESTGVDSPIEEIVNLQDAYSAHEILWLDLIKAGVSSVIWATGYRFDYSMVKAPVFDEFHYPVTNRGISAQAGLYFAGLPWLPYQKSGLLLGVSEVAAHIAEDACLR